MERVGGDVGLELGNHLGGEVERQHGLGSAGEAQPPELLEPGDLRPCPELAGELRVGGTAPENEGAVGRRTRRGRATRREQRSRRGDVRFEATGVDVVVGDAKRVAGGRCDEQPCGRPRGALGFERLAQRADEGLDRADRSWRRFGPQVVDEPRHRDDCPASDEQPREHSAVPRARQSHRPVLVASLQGPEYLERDHATRVGALIEH